MAQNKIKKSLKKRQIFGILVIIIPIFIFGLIIYSYADIFNDARATATVTAISIIDAITGLSAFLFLLSISITSMFGLSSTVVLINSNIRF